MASKDLHANTLTPTTLSTRRQDLLDAYTRLPPARPHTCPHCSQITIRLPRSSSRQNVQTPTRMQFEVEGLTRDVFRAAVASACPLFSRAELGDFDALVEAYPELVSEVKAGNCTFKFSFQAYPRRGVAKPLGKSDSQIYQGGLKPSYIRSGRDMRWIFPDQDIFLGSESSVPAWLRYRWRANTSPVTDDALDLARRWFSECLDGPDHSKCRLPPEDYVPTRLVVVPQADDDDSVRIVQTNGVYVPWCALSYCWGGPQLMRTTTQNFAQGERVISLSELPLTILDALLVCKSLSIRFIWIDSLCILQDLQEDLIRELASMPKIYKNASLTLIAASASACTEGFLNPRTPREDPAYPAPAQIRCIDGRGAEGSIVSHGTFLPKEPIHGRGWTAQELLLSPRTLQYNLASTAWVCASQKHTDNPHLAAVDDAASNKLFFDLRARFNTRKPRHDQAIIIWLRIIDEYTNRDLGYQTDKLIALSAIAADFGAQTGWTYAAGLWQEYLRCMLGWRCAINDHHTRPAKYRAPSWSWASLDGLFNDLEILSYQADREVREEDIAIFAGELHVECEPALKELPCGDAKSGFLRARCLGLDAVLQRHLDVPFLRVGEHVFGRIENSNQVAARRNVYLDAPADDLEDWEQNGGWDVVVLPFDPFTYREYLCLVVRRTSESPEEFQRVGLLTVSGVEDIDAFHDMLQDVEPRDFTIL